MPVDADKGVLEKTVRHLSSVCNTYINYISAASDIKEFTYKLKDGKRCFGFIPAYSNKLIRDLIILHDIIRAAYGPNWGAIKFLDIGCGIGNIILLANAVGFSADGLEYDLKTYRVAKRLCRPSTHIFNGDMREFRRYKEYDVLYYYQPMHDSVEMGKFSYQLAKAMKPGAYVIANGASKGYRESEKFELIDNISHHVWKKKEK